MKPMLTKAAPHPMYYYRDGVRIAGPHPELWGDATGLWGGATGLWGDVTGLRGDATGLWGDATGLWGDLDACEITDAEREHGIDVAALVRSEP